MKTFLFSTLLLLTAYSWGLPTTIAITSEEHLVLKKNTNFFRYTSDQELLPSLCGRPRISLIGLPYWSNWYEKKINVWDSANQRAILSDFNMPSSIICKIIPYDLSIESNIEIPNKGTIEFTFSIYSLRDSFNHPLEDRFEGQPSAIQCQQVEKTTAICTIDLNKIDFNGGYWSNRNKVQVTYFTNHFKEALDQNFNIHLVFKEAN